MARAPAPLREITSVMEEQRRALLAGDFAALDGAELRLSQAAGRLNAAGLSRDDLETLAALAARNARLLAAARSGLDQVRARRGGGVTPALMTYDARGRQHGGTPVGATLSRR